MPAATPKPTTPGAGADRTSLAWAVLETVPDPEIPVVSIRDLGILRGIGTDADGTLEVVITPTYSGCPAMAQIAQDIGAALDGAGLAPWRIRTALAPAWSTDWISPAGRARLRDFGIAPPGACGSGQEGGAARPLRFVPGAAGTREAVACPRCGSLHTQELARFASTACKALYRCLDCREPFDYFKPY
ncbi:MULTISPECIES: 1,2-phenylacetyl-CoA epoxidase subunit PaaD [Cupriavidus]|nr:MULTISPECIES: 1,2-phenylacetyl-CoA epoxidase subunit PaaD [Cupriavidus]